MTLHPNITSQILSALGDIFARNQHAEQTVDARLKANRKWGARDRRLFAESVYENVRWWRLNWHLAGLPDAECLLPEAITDARLQTLWEAYWARRAGELQSPPADSEAAAPAVADIPLAIRASIPDWLFELGAKEFGSEWPALLAALNQPADVFLRANSLHTTAAALKADLALQSIEAEEVPGLPGALRLKERRKLGNSTAFCNGLFEIQDAASQHVAPLLQVEPGQIVMDACCGAGGKTLHLAALMRNKGRLLALDVRDKPLHALAERAKRASISIIELGVLDKEQVHTDLFASADRVLLDVPCSGLGTLRRNADVKWKLTAKEVARLTRVQAQILGDYSQFVKPGGKLVYATCSFLPDENERQIEAFLARHGAEWTLEQELHLRPDREGFDGFYAARLRRNSQAAA
ncbi:MAG: RsmB/NOP family class I SAM-dependent RNA methyltransferase [Verrucomicrobia bacterium]|nr:RsmB/NOP family class I SAM-dependent RNA methyltransferase [Verrucomicrobiota bacterium]